jgi:hypothetical protein
LVVIEGLLRLEPNRREVVVDGFEGLTVLGEVVAESGSSPRAISESRLVCTQEERGGARRRSVDDGMIQRHARNLGVTGQPRSGKARR